MKCKHCDGSGVIVEVNYGFAEKYMCDYCWGTGVVEPLTNEEWLRQASTEELEKLFEKAQDYGATCSNGDKDKCSYCGCPWCEMGFAKWLKEIHNNEVL